MSNIAELEKEWIDLVIEKEKLGLTYNDKAEQLLQDLKASTGSELNVLEEKIKEVQAKLTELTGIQKE